MKEFHIFFVPRKSMLCEHKLKVGVSRPNFIRKKIIKSLDTEYYIWTV